MIDSEARRRRYESGLVLGGTGGAWLGFWMAVIVAAGTDFLLRGVIFVAFLLVGTIAGFLVAYVVNVARGDEDDQG
jgi:hypothetical protein